MSRLAGSRRRWWVGGEVTAAFPPADLEPEWGLGQWVPAQCLCEGGLVTGWALRVALLTLVSIPSSPLVSGTEKVTPCQCRLGGSSGSPRTAFSMREKAGLCNRRAADPAPSVPSQRAKSALTPFLGTASKGAVIQRVDRDELLWQVGCLRRGEKGKKAQNSAPCLLALQTERQA